MFCTLYWCRIRGNYILKVYIYFLCINKQRGAISQFDNNPFISPLRSKYWTTGIYQGSDDPCKGDRDSDLNCLASEILGNTLLQPTNVSDCSGPELDVFSIVIVDLILRSAVVWFSQLCAKYYYNLTGLVCYVYSVYNL